MHACVSVYIPMKPSDRQCWQQYRPIKLIRRLCPVHIYSTASNANKRQLCYKFIANWILENESFELCCDSNWKINQNFPSLPRWTKWKHINNVYHTQLYGHCIHRVCDMENCQIQAWHFASVIEDDEKQQQQTIQCRNFVGKHRGLVCTNKTFAGLSDQLLK